MTSPLPAAKLGDIVARFSVFTGFWAIAYFFMCLTAFAIAHPRWTFTVEVGAFLTWFAIYLTVALTLGNLIGVVSNLLRPHTGTVTHGDFDGRFAGNWRQVIQFCFGTLVSGLVFLALARLTGSLAQQWFDAPLDILNGTSLGVAALAVAIESTTTTLLVLGIIFYVKGQLEAGRLAHQPGTNGTPGTVGTPVPS
ncbi:hypothetical protein J8C01_12585 [Chloracidobacterium sp. D]|jgi:hypothetical protein|uniref:hypothetical protein n=1 Tax=Chloracidobacterium sp. D TaxID=2821536 RepID=UPI001B8DA976|nr:hypothetical protein [Chloracidobacterium sp. D]QUV83505.1 hypothetical protein J8C01_12585 [Chloracidobacterium sp. D]